MFVAEDIGDLEIETDVAHRQMAVYKGKGDNLVLVFNWAYN